MEEIKLFISGLGGITQLVEYLPSVHETLGSMIGLCTELGIELDAVACTCHPS